MTMTRLCPLKAMAPCWKERCAWYSVRNKQCAIPLIASQLKKGIKMEVDWGA